MESIEKRVVSGVRERKRERNRGTWERKGMLDTRRRERGADAGDGGGGGGCGLRR